MSQKKTALHAEGKHMMVVEHFGQGRAGLELGADKVICSGLAQFSGAPQNVVQVVGDALSEEKEKELEHAIRKAKDSGYALPLILFRPVGGLSVNSLNVYAFRKLYSQFRTAYELLDDNGVILVGAFGSGVELRFLRRMLEVTGCSDLLLENSNADALGIRKKESIRALLPTEEEWARIDNGLVHELVALDILDSRNAVGTRPRVRVQARNDPKS